MTYEQLRVFQAVVSEETFHSASEKLHKSQPAVSKMIQNLEEELGIDQLNREGYRPELTEAGKLFYEKSRLFIEQTVKLKSLAQRLAKYEEPSVSMAVNAVCPLPPVSTMLRSVQCECGHRQFLGKTGGYRNSAQVKLNDSFDPFTEIAAHNQALCLTDPPMAAGAVVRHWLDWE